MVDPNLNEEEANLLKVEMDAWNPDSEVHNSKWQSAVVWILWACGAIVVGAFLGAFTNG